MIQSIQAGSTGITSGTSVQSTKVITETTADTTAADTQKNAASSSDGDTVEISDAGRKRMQTTHVAYSSTSTANGGTGVAKEGTTDDLASMLSSAAASVGITQKSAEKAAASSDAAAVTGASSGSSTGSSSGTSSSSSDSLSSYSVAQLKEMLSKGEITQAQYNTAIAEKQTESSSDSSSSGSSSDSDSTAAAGSASQTQA